MIRVYNHNLFTMSAPSSKRPRREVSFDGNRLARKRKSVVPRSLKARAIRQRNVHVLSGSGTFALDGDLGIAFSWDTANAYINTVASGNVPQTISGLSELSSVYQMIRLAKVEITVLPPANSLDYSTQVSTSTKTIIPTVFMYADHNDNDVPSRTTALQDPALRIGQLDKIQKYTVYPKLEGSNGMIDIGSNQKNIFMQASVTSTQKWHGFKIFFDMNTIYWPASNVTVLYKCYWECAHTK